MKLKILSSIGIAVILYFALSSSLSCIKNFANDLITAGEKITNTVESIESTAQQVQDEYNNIVDTFNEKAESIDDFVSNIG